MKKIGMGIAALLLIGVIIMSITFYTCKKESDAIVFENVNMLDIADGTYVGECNLTLVKVKVSVCVQQHKITEITLLNHENGMGGDAEMMLEEMKKENTVGVDVVSGATISSKVIHKAMENALRGN